MPGHPEVETATITGVGHLGMLLSPQVVGCIVAALPANHGLGKTYFPDRCVTKSVRRPEHHEMVFATVCGGVGGVGLSGVPERRPDPLRWLWCTFGGGLGPSYREWVLHDVLTSGRRGRTHLSIHRQSDNPEGKLATSYERVARISKVSPPTDTPFEPMRSASLVRSSEAFSAARTRWFE